MSDFYRVIGRHASTPGAIPSTVLMIVAGATKRIWVHEVQIGSSNAAALAGAEFSLGRPTTAGTGGVAATPVASDSGAPAAIFTALSAATPWSAEPTQPSNYDFRLGLDAVTTYIYTPKVPILVPLSGRFACRIETDNSATKVQWTCTMTVEE